MDRWMRPSVVPEGDYLAVFRCCFEAAESCILRFDFSADNRAQFYLDGKRIADGPERGAAEYWYYKDVSAEITPGKHVLTARLCCIAVELPRRARAQAQMSIQHGLWIKDLSGLLTSWQCQIETGCLFSNPYPNWGDFPRVHVTKDHNPDILQGSGGVWEDVVFFDDDRVLHAPDLPPMRYEKVVPERRSDILYYFPEYVCAWQTIRFAGKGTVEIRWAETPYMTPELNIDNLKGVKGKRDGAYFIASPDVFDVDGSFTWQDYWWHAGHYVEIKTAGDVKYDIEFYRTGYPYAPFEPCSLLEKMAFETLQACSFETYMDCPYYEQLMYIGDSRLEALCTYLLTDDHRLPAKALKLLSLSQREDGSLNSQYPSCAKQTIPSFMLIWLLMLSDYWRIHGDDALVTELRPRAIKLLGFFDRSMVNGLLCIDGWNFVDWCRAWSHGVPPGEGANSPMNLLFLLAMQRMAEMDLIPGLDEKAVLLAKEIKANFYDSDKKMYALDLEKQHYSEHPQILAMLAFKDDSVIPGLYTPGLVPCSIYFSYYYLEACQLFGLKDLMDKRLDLWRKTAEAGLTTFPEEFENPRSDCHAWSSHILRILLAERNQN